MQYPLVPSFRQFSHSIVALLFVMSCGQAMASPVVLDEREALNRLFADKGVSGTFVAHAPVKGTFTGHNATRAVTRFVPASTFKIPNSLIGLVVGAVRSVDEVFYLHDGQPKYLKAWERDTNLSEAITVSNVPAYQTLARRIGLPAMEREVKHLGYGNADIGAASGQPVDTFWLEGPLQISAMEQSVFLAKLATNQLPYPPAVQEAVAEICVLERGKKWTLYGKTGLVSLPGDKANGQETKTGWFVGWVEQRNGHITSFALNMNMTSDKGAHDLDERINMTKACLKTLGVLPL